MNFATFMLLVVTFPYWFPVAVAFFIPIGVLWMIVYATACTVHMLYARVRYGKWGRWHLLYPNNAEPLT